MQSEEIILKTETIVFEFWIFLNSDARTLPAVYIFTKSKLYREISSQEFFSYRKPEHKLTDFIKKNSL